MGLLDRLFSRKPHDYLDKGNKYLAAGSFYEARCSFEEGLAACGNDCSDNDLLQSFGQQIAAANHGLALLNLDEAYHAKAAGNQDKAREHCELAKTLTTDAVVREKTDSLMASLSEKINDTKELEPASHCSSCSSCSPESDDKRGVIATDDADLDSRTHYELLIHQLPQEMFSRYACLGEDFACMFIAASRDQHQDALELLEAWHVPGNDDDIYWNEKGKILYRLGRVTEAEHCFRSAIGSNADNHLPYLGLALLLFEGHRLAEAGQLLDEMISSDIFAGQALMMRGELQQITGDVEQALATFASLLKTGLAKAAAEKIYEILQGQNRHAEAAAVRKQYLASCSH